MAETSTTAIQRHGPAWLVVAVQDDDAALIVQNSLARIITGEHADEAELFAESERAEESGAEEEALAEALLIDSVETRALAIQTSVGEEAVLAVLEHPSASDLFILVPDPATKQWLADHGEGSREVLLIDGVENCAAPHIREHAVEPLGRLRGRLPEDALARAMQTASRAFWALNGDIAKKKLGITARNRESILGEARVSRSAGDREADR
jgi:hypothetical protein